MKEKNNGIKEKRGRRMRMSFPFLSLRDWIEFLEEKGDLVRNRVPMGLRGDIAAVARKIALLDGPAVLHENIENYPGWRIFSDGLTARRRQLWALNVPARETAKVILDKLEKAGPVKPEVVQTGSCKEVKLFGEDVDLLQLPAAFTGGYETTPYVTAGISFIKDPETGWTNAGIRRFQVIGRNKLCNLILPFQHEGVIFHKYMQQRRPMPIAVVIGTDPLTCLLSMMPAPEQFDEMDYWGALAGEPLQVVKCETSDLLVPATAEIVIEGEIDPEKRALEGPFPEFPGYYSGNRMCPVIDVKAITMRRDPIYQYMNMGKPPSEGHNSGALVYEIELYRQIKPLVPEIADVGVLSTWTITTAVSISKKARLRTPGLEKKLGLAVKAVKAGSMVKNVFIVDDDVDVHNINDILWSFCVKFQPAKDIQIVEGTSGIYLDPSEPWVGHGGKYSGHSSYAIYDCTEKLPPYDEGYRRGVALPPPDATERVESNWQSYGFGAFGRGDGNSG